MSNLNSIFDILRSWPNGGALDYNFEALSGSILVEGLVFTSADRNLDDASVLRIVDDSLVTAPALTSADRGKAYHVAGVGGAWSVFAVGDIVTWDGTGWVLSLANVAGEPPDGTRAVVVEASAAGSFAGDETKIYVFTAGAPGSWALADTPVEGNRVKIVDDAVYSAKWYDYTASSTWGKAAKQQYAAAYATPLTSPAGPSHLSPLAKPDAWVVIQGNDQWDAQFVGNMSALKLNSGTVFKIQHDDADTLVAGTLLQVNAGVLEAHTDLWPVGQVIYTNGVAGSNGFIHVAAF